MRRRSPWGIRPGRRGGQAVFGFKARTERRERLFKRLILMATLLAIVAMVGGTHAGRDSATALWLRGRGLAARIIGAEPDREVLQAQVELAREQGVRATMAGLRNEYDSSDAAMRRLMEVVGMAPDSALLRPGNYHSTLYLSSKVFEADDRGRSYRLRPNVRSIALRHITLKNGLAAMFMVPDTPEAREAGARAGGVVVEESAQTTNSWGLRGPEPEPLPNANLRGLVLGDSFMQGLFIGDDATPPRLLGRVLQDALGRKVEILNTGCLGYSPEQYYHTLIEYFPRFRPRFVVLSLFANDFGDVNDALKGKGDWRVGKYWLDEIFQYCRTNQVPCVVSPIPCEIQLTAMRREGHYPGQISNVADVGSFFYLFPIEEFVNENIRLMREGDRKGARPANSPLFNGHIADGHFSPIGSELWANTIGKRLALLLGGEERGE